MPPKTMCVLGDAAPLMMADTKGSSHISSNMRNYIIVGRKGFWSFLIPQVTL